MTTRRRSGFGKVRKLPSGRYQASYIGPDAARHNAPSTFQTKGDAAAWLSAQQTDIARGAWGQVAQPRRERVPTFAAYAADWLRTRPLRGRTPIEYRSVLAGHLLPTFGALRMNAITPQHVREWHTSYGQRTPSARAKSYRLLHAIMTTAVEDELIVANPCRVRRGGSDKRSHVINVATEAEVDQLADAMPAEWRMLVLLAAWCAMRFGELSELRRGDVDLDAGVLMISRAATRTGHGLVAGPPKSEAGIRSIAVPAFLLPELAQHLLAYAQPGDKGLLFTAPRGGQLYQSVVWREWNLARASIGRGDLRFHDLRHTGATWAAEAGATTKQLMRRIGHANPTMAMIYQHATDRGDEQIAARLSRRGSKATTRRARKSGAA
jgi:integrase